MIVILSSDLEPVTRPGKFNIIIGGNSVNLIETSFEVTE
jgi:hypothetical protein